MQTGFQFSVPNLDFDLSESRSLFSFDLSVSPLSFDHSASPPPRLHQLPPASAFKPSTSYKAASSSPASAFNSSTTSQPPPFNHITADLLLFRLQIFGFSILDLSLFCCCCFAPLPTVSGMDI
uniref:Uncharacterized protein n=1 Tax=Fagus sylvatica TaxID=28930 RepID=A0A2N9IR87_FAGSY